MRWKDDHERLADKNFEYEGVDHLNVLTQHLTGYTKGKPPQICYVNRDLNLISKLLHLTHESRTLRPH
jgi:hypothetical protein